VRIATWNVNSLKARLEKVTWWLERARPDVLLMQETKLADPDAPTDAFRSTGYVLAHHGEGRWHGHANAHRCGNKVFVTHFGSKSHPSPSGSPVASFESIGSIGGSSGNPEGASAMPL